MTSIKIINCFPTYIINDYRLKAIIVNSNCMAYTSASESKIIDFIEPSRGLLLIVEPSYLWFLSKIVINI